MTQPSTAKAVDGGAAPASLSNEAIDAAIQEPAVDEAFARRLGWRPQEEFRGPSDKWVDAATFVEKVQKETPILRERLRTQDSMIQNMQAELRETKRIAADLAESQRELVETSRDARERGFNYEAARIEAGMRKAVENADTAAYDALRLELDGLYRQRAQKKEPPKQTDPPNGAQTKTDPVVDQFARDNPWLQDRKLYREAVAVEANIHEDNPHLSTSDRLAKVKEEMARRHPERFENPARRQPSTVSQPAGQVTRHAKPKAKTEADLPAEDRAVMERLVRQKVLTKDQYLKDYKWS